MPAIGPFPVFAFAFFCTGFPGRGQGITPVPKKHSPFPRIEASRMPYNRLLVPAGTTIRYGDPGLENHALDDALIPGTHLLVVEDRYGLAIIQTLSQKVLFRLSLRDDPTLGKCMSTYSGLKVVSIQDSTCIFWGVANANGLSFLAEAYWDGKSAKIIRAFPFRAVAPAALALPNEVSVLKEEGTDYLYVVLDGNNQVEKLRIPDGKVIWKANSGAAPFGMAITRDKIFVTNWGGELPEDSLKPAAGIPWGKIFIDSTTGAGNNGSVTVVDRFSGHLLNEIPVGLHPNAILLSPDQAWAFVACGNSDNVFIINTLLNRVVDSISVRLSPLEDPFIGDSPDGIALSSKGSSLYVSNGMDNAVAVIRLSHPVSKGRMTIRGTLQGFIPTEAYPSGIQVDASRLYVCNLEGEGAGVRGSRGFNSHHQLATISLIPLPSPARLQAYSRAVYRSNLVLKAKLALSPPRMGVAPRPIPARIGEPSVFRHVVYIIKENRTYDQVLGDMKEGNGDSALCVFGAGVTPNEHQLAREFFLMDDFYVSGKCSAEGHQWTDAAMVTDYVEKNVRAWFRSYPHVQNDAMVYDKNGFIWNDALDHGKTVIIYGEAATPHFNNSLGWTDIYSLFRDGKPFSFYNSTTISRVSNILCPTYPGFDDHKIPDQVRASAFISDLRRYEGLPGDQWPDLLILALPADHTAGMRPGFPTPLAMVADNDLALGQILEAISHSRFWDSTAVFVTEDDSQDGWDHVSAYRTTAFVMSPYSHLDHVVHDNYNQPDMVRTMELILGIPPMNALDATATPMFNCFGLIPDTIAYNAIPAGIALNEMNGKLAQLKGEARQMALFSEEHQFDHIDGGSDDLLNRILWFSTMKDKPYPLAITDSDKK